MKKRRLIICVLLCYISGITALQADNRLKMIHYKPNQIITLLAHDFVQTSIEFEKGEAILDVITGDSSAWQLERSSAASNILFVKPQVEYSHTNLKVISDKRQYEFELKTADDSDEIIYSVIFQYPKPPKPFKALVSEKKYYNLNYCYHGDKQPLPIKVYDDGTFTYFQFKPNQSFPAIFAVDGNRKEKLVNFRINSELVVVEKVTGQWTLRDGLNAATLINQSYIKALA